jgi:hypothetical protein
MPLRVPYHRVAGLIAKGNSKISLCASGAGKPERLISGFFLIWGLTFRVENLGTLVVRQHITNLYCASSSFRYLL